MNFLSHYYMHPNRETSNPYYVLGLILPDLVKTANSKWRLKEKALNTTELEQASDSTTKAAWIALQAGADFHHQVDAFFHNSPFFKAQCKMIQAHFKAQNVLQNTRYRFFVAHVLLEMMIDRLLLQEEEQMGYDFYQELHLVEEKTVEAYLKKALQLENVERFSIILNRFRKSQFLFDYKGRNKLLTRLGQVYQRATKQRFDLDEAEDTRLYNSLVDIENELRSIYLPFFEALQQQVEVDNSLQILEQGGTFLYPTATVWGIGCDATNEAAVQQIYALKQRPDSKALITLVDSLELLKQYVTYIPAAAEKYLQDTARPTTIIYPQSKNLPSNLGGADGSIAIRVTQHPFCKALIAALGKPIVSTSANISGQATAKSFAAITADIKQGVGYVVNFKVFPDKKTVEEEVKPSRIILIKANGEEVVIRG